jgi:hypothetical protein
MNWLLLIIIIPIPLCLFAIVSRLEKMHQLLRDFSHQKGDFDPAIDEEEFERVSKKFGWDERATRLREGAKRRRQWLEDSEK